MIGVFDWCTSLYNQSFYGKVLLYYIVASVIIAFVSMIVSCMSCEYLWVTKLTILKFSESKLLGKFLLLFILPTILIECVFNLFSVFWVYFRVFLKYIFSKDSWQQAHKEVLQTYKEEFQGG